MEFLNAKDNPPPKDGTLLLLIVKNSNPDSWNPTEDSEVFRTIGFNNLEGNGIDAWQCAGWNWCADKFTETTGDIIGWSHLPEVPKWADSSDRSFI